MLLHIASTNYYYLVLTVLAVWRIASLVCYENGPFKILFFLRKLFYRLKMGSLIECFHCISFWIAIAAVLLVFQGDKNVPLLIFAVSGSASIIERLIS